MNSANNSKGHGYISAGPSRSGGKKIDEWVFVSPSSDANRKVTIQMFNGKDGLTFKALSPSLTVTIEDTDIQRLREKVEAWFQEDDMIQCGLNWEDWLEIVVEGCDRTYKDEIGVSLNIQRKIIKRSVKSNGEAVALVTNHGNAYIKPFPKPKRAGEEDPIEGTGIFAGLGRRSIDHEYSYVPATPENLAAIEAIQSGLVSVRQRVADFMHQSHQAGAIDNFTSHLGLLANDAKDHQNA